MAFRKPRRTGVTKRSYTVIPLDQFNEQNFLDIMFKDEASAVKAALDMMQREPEIDHCDIKVEAFNGEYWAASNIFTVGRE